MGKVYFGETEFITWKGEKLLGDRFEYEGIELIVNKRENEYCVYSFECGYKIIGYIRASKECVIQSAKFRIDEYGIEKVKLLINEARIKQTIANFIHSEVE
jgi:hypothetical protein